MSSRAEEAPMLVAQSGPLNGQRWPLRQVLVLGREPDCDIVIPDRQVSRHHARISITDQEVQLEDLESKNGTFLNGKTVNSIVPLQDSDVIQIALIQSFVFLSTDATLPLNNNIEYGKTGQDSRIMLGLEEIGLRLEKKSRRVWIKKVLPDGSISEAEVIPPLSISQYRLLELLVANRGRVVSRQELSVVVWGESQLWGGSEQALDALIRRLRDRISSVDSTHEYIITVRGHGIRLENPRR